METASLNDFSSKPVRSNRVAEIESAATVHSPSGPETPIKRAVSAFMAALRPDFIMKAIGESQCQQEANYSNHYTCSAVKPRLK
jgi:hypothetical protein